MSHLRTRSSEGGKVFLISGVTEEVRKDLAKKISQLGGRYFDLQYFKAICTHVICGKLSKSEKFLGACASGKWVVHPDFIYQSVTAGCWLDEEQFEWCDQNILQRHTDVTVSVDMLYASRRWRFELGGDRHGAFVGWKVAVVAGAQKSKVMKRLLISGGADVFNLSIPVRNPAKVANTLGYIFVSEQNIGMVAHLFEYGVLCVKPDFIGDYLLKNPEPDPMDYLIQQTDVPQVDEGDNLQSSGQTSFLANTQNAPSPASCSTPNVTGSPDAKGGSCQDLLLNLLERKDTGAVGISTPTQQRSPRLSSTPLIKGTSDSSKSTPTKTIKRPSASTNHQSRALVTFIGEEVEMKSEPFTDKKLLLDRQNTLQKSPIHTGKVVTVEYELKTSNGTVKTNKSLHKKYRSSLCVGKDSNDQYVQSLQDNEDLLASYTDYAGDGSGVNSSTTQHDVIKSSTFQPDVVKSSKPQIDVRSSKPQLDVVKCAKTQLDVQLSKPQLDVEKTSEPQLDIIISSKPQLDVVKSSNSQEDVKLSKSQLDEVKSSKPRRDVTKSSKPQLDVTNSSKPQLDAVKSSELELGVARTPKGRKKIKRHSLISLSPITVFFKPVSSPNTTYQTQGSNNQVMTKQEPKEPMMMRCAKKSLSQLKADKDASSTVCEPTADLTMDLGIYSSSKSSVEQEQTTMIEDSCCQDSAMSVKDSSDIIVQHTGDSHDQSNSSGTVTTSPEPTDNVDIDIEEDTPLLKTSQQGDLIKTTRKRKSGQSSGLQQYFKETKRQKVSESEWRPTKFSTNYTDEESLPGVLCLHSAMTQIIQTTFEEEELIIMALQELKARVSQKYCPPHETLALLIHKILPRDGSDLEGSLVYEVLMQIVHHHPPISMELQQLYLQALAGDNDNVAVGQEWKTIHNCIRNILYGENSGVRKRNLLLFQFIREVLQQNLQYFVLQEKMSTGVKHLWLRVLWCPSYHVVFNSRCRELLDLMADMLSLVRTQSELQQNGQMMDLLQDIVWLIAMAAECCRLEETRHVRGVWSLQIERVSAFVHEITKRLIDANLQCRWLLQSVLSGLQLPWLCVGVCQQMLNSLDDYLLTESSPQDTSAISLAAIVRTDLVFTNLSTCLKSQVVQYIKGLISFDSSASDSTTVNLQKVGHYFYLLPRLHLQSSVKENLKPAQNNRLQSCSTRSVSQKTGLHEKANMSRETLDIQSKKVNKRNKKGETQLHRACIEGSVTKVRQLLQVPDEPSVCVDGNEVLHHYRDFLQAFTDEPSLYEDGYVI